MTNTKETIFKDELDIKLDVIYQNFYEAAEKCSQTLKEKALLSEKSSEISWIFQDFYSLMLAVAKAETTRKTMRL